MNFKLYSSDSVSVQGDESFWPQLKQAIATTSGFHRWALDKGLNPQVKGEDLDDLVHTYLKQTLETLAY
ncbi:hypothetical protein [Lyngbya confervoides]|uniref:Uncharacterized protein n=1 Tax=Lyngbya confervoides BDU141951 TaxID=1574623 RepID=A0ABD4T9A7_9CYAN|nr:hypothetical protein [Lyngbya confervoides]MCM1985162.1 hypothetical protein [Lyngbya confervoides BDU141951]